MFKNHWELNESCSNKGVSLSEFKYCLSIVVQISTSGEWDLQRKSYFDFTPPKCRIYHKKVYLVNRENEDVNENENEIRNKSQDRELHKNFLISAELCCLKSGFMYNTTALQEKNLLIWFPRSFSRISRHSLTRKQPLRLRQ